MLRRGIVDQSLKRAAAVCEVAVPRSREKIHPASSFAPTSSSPLDNIALPPLDQRGIHPNAVRSTIAVFSPPAVSPAPRSSGRASTPNVDHQRLEQACSPWRSSSSNGLARRCVERPTRRSGRSQPCCARIPCGAAHSGDRSTTLASLPTSAACDLGNSAAAAASRSVQCMVVSFRFGWRGVWA